MHDDELPDAVVFGTEPMLLQTCRALHRRGVRVTAIVSSDANNHVSKSRCCERLIYAGAKPMAFIEALLELGPTFRKRAVLFPCEDVYVLSVSRKREQLEKWYHIILPAPETVERMMDKRRFYQFAEQQGIRVPRSYLVKSYQSLMEVIEDLPYPCILKPGNSKSLAWRQAARRKKGFLAKDPDELLAVYQPIAHWARGLIVQEWIPGPVTNLISCKCYFNRQSEPTAVIVNRKIRQIPRRIGVGTCVEPWQDAEVKEIAFRALRLLQHHGLAAFEFKRHETTGEPVLLDPNFGRPALTGVVAEANGVPLIYSQYCDAAGLDAPPTQLARRPIKWISWRSDFLVARAAWRDGDLSLSAWLRSLLGRKTYSVWAWDDPMPAFHSSSIIRKLRSREGAIQRGDR